MDLRLAHFFLSSSRPRSLSANQPQSSPPCRQTGERRLLPPRVMHSLPPRLDLRVRRISHEYVNIAAAHLKVTRPLSTVYTDATCAFCPTTLRTTPFFNPLSI
ncbi:unnamed protein product [Protopolystoma xenopodis]|uniref:Uncharacterized protein n=1 Tax=Protopolystoma xenopodis TaxID=117903 RepID=A0A3S5BUG6_9PLAT|nr:unnamed protein product [Protopolystoma xenopodis]